MRIRDIDLALFVRLFWLLAVANAVSIMLK